MNQKYYSSYYSNIEELENEINNMIKCNPEINVDDIQIFAQINENNLYPIEMSVQNNKIAIKNDEYLIGKKLFLGTKRQFIYKSYIN